MVVEATTVTYFNDRNIEILEQHDTRLLELDAHHISLGSFAGEILHPAVESLG